MGADKHNIALTEGVYYILLSLYKPMHGYGIMQHVSDISNGRVHLAAGTLYGALNTLTEKGYIKALNNKGNSRKKEYEITELGKEIVEEEIERLDELIKNGKKTVRG